MPEIAMESLLVGAWKPSLPDWTLPPPESPRWALHMATCTGTHAVFTGSNGFARSYCALPAEPADS